MKKLLSLVLAATMLAAALAVASPVSAKPGPFSDVAEDRWSFEAVGYAYRNEYMIGVGDGLFDPERPLTRAEVVAVLWRREGEPEPSVLRQFTDVDEDAWYARAVGWAREEGIVFGVTGDLFGPELPVTREQLASILFRLSSRAPVSVPERADLSVYSDFGEISEWASEALGWAAESGVMIGTEADTLSPDGTATREQFAEVIYRYDGSFKLEYNVPVLFSHYTEEVYPLVTDADVYVSPDGNDGGAGTLGDPLASFGAAIDKVIAIKETKREGDIVVAFKAGDYGSLSVTLGHDGGGTADQRVVWCKYGDGDVVFNNGFDVSEDEFVPISEEEKGLFRSVAAGKIMKADVSDRLVGYDPLTAMVMSDEGVCVLARYPDLYDDGTDHLLMNAGETIDENHIVIDMSLLKRRIDNYHTTEDLLLYGYLTTGWYKDTLETADYDRETGSFRITHPEKARMGKLRLLPEFDSREWNQTAIVNVSEELDREGEYWVDRASGTFYVYSPSGDYHFTGGTRDMIDATSAEYVTFRGLTFKNSNTRMICAYGHPRGLTVEGCTFSGCAGEAMIRIDGGTRGVPLDVTVRNCDFSVSAEEMVDVSGRSSDDPYHTSTGVLIDNNSFTLASLKVGCIGAVRVNTHAPTVSHNYFKRCYWEAIDFRHATNLVAEYNVFEEVGCNGDDTGALQGFRAMGDSDGNVTRYNLFLNIGGGTNGRYCLYLDGTWGMEVCSNIFYNCSSCVMHNGIPRRNYVHDNIVVTPDSSGARLNSVHHEGIDLIEYALEQNDLSLITDDWGYTHWTGQLAYFDSHPDVRAQTEELYPGLLDIVCDMDRMWDREFIMHSSVKICGNAQINAAGHIDDFDDYNLTYSDITPDTGYTLDQNPFFVNPTTGDYRMRDDADFENIPFELIGRY